MPPLVIILLQVRLLLKPSIISPHSHRLINTQKGLKATTKTPGMNFLSLSQMLVLQMVDVHWPRNLQKDHNGCNNEHNVGAKPTSSAREQPD